MCTKTQQKSGCVCEQDVGRDLAQPVGNYWRVKPLKDRLLCSWKTILPSVVKAYATQDRLSSKVDRLNFWLYYCRDLPS